MLFKLVDISTVWVNAEVPEAQAAQVRPGSAVEARVTGYPDAVFKGKVGALLPEVNAATRTLRARIELPNPAGRLKPGMFATLTFASRQGKQAVLVPSEAVIRTGQRDVVVVALGEGARVFGYAVGLDLTRRDLQSAAKAKGLPWDTGKAFDHSAPIGEIAPAALVCELAPRTLSLTVNGTQRQRATLDQLIWDVPEILAELSKLFELKAGDLVFMGTPAGVSALQVGDRFEARLDDVLSLSGHVAPPRPTR